MAENEATKRSHAESEDILADVRGIVCDTAGTFVAPGFLKEKFSSTVQENLKSYLESHWDKDECQQDVEALRQQAVRDKEAEVEGVIDIPSAEEEKDSIMEAVVKNVLWQMEQERYDAALETLQSHVIRDPFKTGKLQAEVSEDFLNVAKNWAASGKKLYVYSTWGKEVQKLLLAYTDKGDLSEYVSGFYDLSTGPKTDKDSYAHIAEEVDVKPEELLFLTDSVEEAKSAAEAGLKACLNETTGVEFTDDDRQNYNCIKSFSELEAEGEKEEGEPPAKK